MPVWFCQPVMDRVEPSLVEGNAKVSVRAQPIEVFVHFALPSRALQGLSGNPFNSDHCFDSFGAAGKPTGSTEALDPYGRLQVAESVLSSLIAEVWGRTAGFSEENTWAPRQPSYSTARMFCSFRFPPAPTGHMCRKMPSPSFADDRMAWG